MITEWEKDCVSFDLTEVVGIEIRSEKLYREDPRRWFVEIVLRGSHAYRFNAESEADAIKLYRRARTKVGSQKARR